MKFVFRIFFFLICAQAAFAEPLEWDAILKDYTAKPGEATAHISFTATNVSTQLVVIDDVKTSCGCTAAKLPARPWLLKPGDSGRMDLSVDLRGKSGTLLKTIDILSTNAPKLLTIRIAIPAGSAVAQDDKMGDRNWNLEVAKADSHAIFKNDCTRCHLAPAFGKYAGDLYQAMCAICHDSPHRASMVPDLSKLDRDFTPAYWKQIVTHGKPGTLMPGFAATEGGPLDDQQINSLVDYLLIKYHKPRKPGPTPAPAKKPEH